MMMSEMTVLALGCRDRWKLLMNQPAVKESRLAMVKIMSLLLCTLISTEVVFAIFLFFALNMS
jgi:hypothetical protein